MVLGIKVRGRQNRDNGRMVEEKVRCNIQEEKCDNRKTGHQEGEIIVIERRRGEKRKTKKRQVINPTAELLSILEFNLFLENKHNLLYRMHFSLHLPSPMNIIFHIIRSTLHLSLSSLIFMCSLFVF